MAGGKASPSPQPSPWGRGGFKGRAAWSLLKVVVFLACLAPLAWLIVQGYRDQLGANPVEFVIHALGDWTLRFLLITLAVTPARRMTGWNRLAGYRRMLGLFAFFYACLHLTTYVAIDRYFDWYVLVADVVKRKYITVGMAAFLLMVPLAWTSTARAVARMGAARWRALHQLIYVIAPLGVAHYWMSVKKDIRLPLAYAVVLAALLAFRAIERARPRRR